MDFFSKLATSRQANNSLLCIGLDPDASQLPAKFSDMRAAFFEFNKAIIDATHDLVCAYKPNSAFYEARGADGIAELKQTCDYLLHNYPEVPIILDFKRGDIGNTNKHYATFAFDYLGADAITIHPYLGKEAVQAFLDCKDKGIIVLCKTSNEGSGEFQDLSIGDHMLSVEVAKNVKQNWNFNNNCLLVIGATYHEDIAQIRQTVGDDMTFLVPGIGAQGGDIEQTLKAGLNQEGAGLIINSARSIIYASNRDNFAEAARTAALKTRDIINKYRS